MAKKKDSTTAKTKPGDKNGKKIAKRDGGEETKTVPPRLDEATRRRQQQIILNIFRLAFGTVLASPDFASILQSVKTALFDRDFARAFGSEENLSVYAARYSPTRALCYASVLSTIQAHLRAIVSVPELAVDQPPPGVSGPPNKPGSLAVLCIGGGAAETVALAAFLSQLPPSPSASPYPLSGRMTLLDSAPWGSAVSSLAESLTSPPPLSKYASEAAKQANAPLIEPDLFSARSVQQDVLALEEDTLPPLLGRSPLLVTLLFTLNELFTSAGIGKTTKFLLSLTAVIPLGSLLLVVDSPGSYSETVLGKDAKRYPMQWLLDRIMLGTLDEPVAGRSWRKLESHDSRWFRLADGLDYPIPLEDMRYQMHLYRAEAVAAD